MQTYDLVFVEFIHSVYLYIFNVVIKAKDFPLLTWCLIHFPERQNELNLDMTLLAEVQSWKR